MKIDLDDPKLKAIVAEAVMASISQDARDAMVVAAITHLITPPPKNNNYYGSQQQPSPLQDAFNRFAEIECRTVLKEQLQTDPVIKAKLSELTQKVITKVLSDDTLVDALARSIVNAIEKGANT